MYVLQTILLSTLKNSYIIYNAYNHYTERSHILERFQLNFLTICNLPDEESFSKKNVFLMLRYTHISIKKKKIPYIITYYLKTVFLFNKLNFNCIIHHSLLLLTYIFL